MPAAPCPGSCEGQGESGPCGTRPKALAPCRGHRHCSRVVPERLGAHGASGPPLPQLHTARTRRALLTQRDTVKAWPPGQPVPGGGLPGHSPATTLSWLVPCGSCPPLGQQPWPLPGLTFAEGVRVRTAPSTLGRGPCVTARGRWPVCGPAVCGAGLGCSRGPGMLACVWPGHPNYRAWSPLEGRWPPLDGFLAARVVLWDVSEGFGGHAGLPHLALRGSASVLWAA